MANKLKSGKYVYMNEEMFRYVTPRVRSFLSNTGLDEILHLSTRVRYSFIAPIPLLDAIGEEISYKNLKDLNVELKKLSFSDLFFTLSSGSLLTAELYGKTNPEELKKDLYIRDMFYHEAGFFGINFLKKNLPADVKNSPGLIVLMHIYPNKIIYARDVCDYDGHFHAQNHAQDIVSGTGELGTEFADFMNSQHKK